MLITLIAVFVFGLIEIQAQCNPEDCPIPTHHYEELGCIPIYSKKNKTCPAYYNCPNLDKRSSDKCYYRGKTYEIDEYVSEAGNYGNCVAGCFCAAEEPANLVCAIYDCARPPDFENPDCYLAAEHNTCCLSRVICPPFKNVANCNINGTIYYEGQRFFPKNLNNKNCICLPNFEGQYVEPFCLPINCGIEIYNSREIANKCAPLFIKDSVCPVNWQCEKSSDKIETCKNGNKRNVKCLYGKKKLNVGDTVFIKSEDRYSSDVKCECLIPPLLTCHQTYIR